MVMVQEIAGLESLTSQRSVLGNV